MELYVRIVQKEGKNVPHPLPLECGFSKGTAYRVLAIHNYSETSDTHIVLSNDRDEIWSISNQHLRTLGMRDSDLLRYNYEVRQPLRLTNR